MRGSTARSYVPPSPLLLQRLTFVAVKRRPLPFIVQGRGPQVPPNVNANLPQLDHHQPLRLVRGP